MAVTTPVADIIRLSEVEDGDVMLAAMVAVAAGGIDVGAAVCGTASERE